MNKILLLRKKIKNLIVEKLLKFSALINSPFISSLVLFKICLFINGRNNKTRVLCLGRSIFLDDVIAMSEFSGRIDYLSIHKSYFQIIFNTIFRKCRSKITEHNYHHINFCDEEKRRYYSFLLSLLPKLKRKLDFQAILSGSFGYLEQQEIAKCCSELHIPFIVLHKEGIAVMNPTTDYANEHYINLQKNYKFIADKILVYSEDAKNLYLEAEVEGLSENKIAIVGIPRLDYYFKNLNKQYPTNNNLVLFSWPLDKERFKWLTNDESKLDRLVKRSKDFHKWVMEFAEKNPNWHVIIKTKQDKHFYNYALNIYNELFKNKIKNLTITNTDTAIDLIKNSTVIMGYCSTTLIEGLISNKMIICPYFGDIISDVTWDWFKNYLGLVNYVGTKKDLLGYLANLDNQKPAQYPKDYRERFLNEIIGNIDSLASIKAEKEIIKVINDY